MHGTTSGFVLWIMGPTSSGKTTIAGLVAERLNGIPKPVLHFDGDEVRNSLGSHLGFEASDRLRVVSKLVNLAKEASISNINVVVSALTANKDARNMVYNDLSPLIVYIHCPVEVCAERDPKGLYALAEKGKIDTLIGFNTEYLPPRAPDLTVDTAKFDAGYTVEQIMEFLNIKGLL